MNNSSGINVCLALFAGVCVVGCSSEVEMPVLGTPQTISVPVSTSGSEATSSAEPEVATSAGPDDKEPVVAPSDPVERQPEESEITAPTGKDATATADADEAEIERAEAYLAANPKDRRAAKVFGGALVEFGRYDRAIAFYKARLVATPDDSEFQYGLGWAYEQSKQWANAVEAYEMAIQSDSENLAAVNNLAWILATAPDDKIRDGERAIKLSKQAFAVAGKQTYFLLDTLAAAFAENGEFKLATEAMLLSLQDAPSAKQKELRARLKLYQQSLPYRTGTTNDTK